MSGFCLERTGNWEDECDCYVHMCIPRVVMWLLPLDAIGCSPLSEAGSNFAGAHELNPPFECILLRKRPAVHASYFVLQSPVVRCAVLMVADSR